MVPKNSGCPKWYPKWWCGHFLNLKNHENWSSYKVCQGVGVPLGYHFGYYLGTIRHFGYHWGTILGTIMSNFCVVKNRFFEIFHIYRYTLGIERYPKWYPYGTQNLFVENYEISAFYSNSPPQDLALFSDFEKGNAGS